MVKQRASTIMLIQFSSVMHVIKDSPSHMHNALFVEHCAYEMVMFACELETVMPILLLLLAYADSSAGRLTSACLACSFAKLQPVPRAEIHALGLYAVSALPADQECINRSHTNLVADSASQQRRPHQESIGDLLDKKISQINTSKSFLSR